MDGALVGATVPIAYRLGLQPTNTATMWEADLNAITMEWGGTLAVVGAATSTTASPRQP